MRSRGVAVPSACMKFSLLLIGRRSPSWGWR